MLIQQVPSLSSLLKGVYTPKCVILHAALLRQGFPHCAIFPTAASRRSLDRVSVPVWLIILSDQLPIFALVSHYLTNKLMGRGLIFGRQLSRKRSPFMRIPCEVLIVSGISTPFEMLSLIQRQITHAILTRAPLYSPCKQGFLVRLACVRHAASVRSEPGSNSLIDGNTSPYGLILVWAHKLAYCYSVFKDRKLETGQIGPANSVY